jgi:hypothetical protein
MRIFVSEFICGGGMAGLPLPESLYREGRAMLCALAADLLRITGCQVATTLDARLEDRLKKSLPDGCDVWPVVDTENERRTFQHLSAASHAVLVIAPETDGQLAERVSQAALIGNTVLNCSPEAIELCGDKIRLAQHFERHSLATISTAKLDWSSQATGNRLSESWVVKPIDGAGSWLTFRIRADSPGDWHEMRKAFDREGVRHKAIIQPFVSGQPLSVACLCNVSGVVDIFPIARQRLSNQFVYLGGSLPALLAPDEEVAIRDLVLRTCLTIPGLNGYVGFDLLLPDEDPSKPLVVEINPRLTTSYIGYRRLSRNNIAERWMDLAGLRPENPHLGPRWSSSPIEFETLESEHSKPSLDGNLPKSH